MRQHLRFSWMGIAAVALATGLFVAAQQPGTPAATPPGQSAPQAPGGPPARAGRPPEFPVRPPAAPEEVAHGKQVFEANCSFCHGSDAMGGETGPGLVLSQPVMDDRNGETITPIVHRGFPSQGMPSFSSLSDGDIQAIAAFLHSLPLTNRGQPSNLDILVGSAQAGEKYFGQHCASCHSVSGAGPGSLAGLGGKYDAKTIQNMIVSGGRAGRGFGRGGPEPPPVPPTTVTVTLASGQTVEGKLDRISAFEVSLTEADGSYRSFLINGADPKVVVHDPLMWHVDMLDKWNDTDIHNLTAYLVTLK